jgi:hypothetical protein
MASIEGTLHLDLLPDKGVRLLFMPRTKGNNSRPLGIPSTALAQSDLESFWGFSPAKAKAAITELETSGHVELSVTVEEQAVSSLFG